MLISGWQSQTLQPKGIDDLSSLVGVFSTYSSQLYSSGGA